MALSEIECKQKGGEIYELVNTARKVCVLPKTKKEEKKAVLID